MITKSFRMLPALLLVLASFVFANSASAASACKGLSSSACSANSSCSWVDSYKRKDGVKVKAHCRTKAKKSSKKKDTKAKKKSTKKTDSKKKDTKKKDTKKKDAKKKSSSGS